MKNSIILITGASGNLGAAAADLFEKKGATLILVDHAKGRLTSQFSHWVNPEKHLFCEGVDVTDADAMAQVVNSVKKKYGRLDGLINTVGGFRAGSALHETGWDTFEHMLNINVKSVYMTSASVIPLMLENQSGVILHVSSGAGLKGSANMAAYSAAKSAVIRLTESMAAELKESGIRVNCILPGTIDTPQNRAAMPKADFSRWVPAESLAEALYFLSSPAARDISGAAVPVYGRS